MRKGNVVFTFLLLLCSVCCAQKNAEENSPFLSSEIFFVYPQYFTKYESQFNYGFGGMISENFIPFKISTGLYYSTKKYFNAFDSQSIIEKTTYSIDYFNIPILIGFPLIKKSVQHNQILITTGLIFNIPRNYRSTTYYKNGNSLVNDPPKDYNSGSSFRLGLGFQRKLVEAFRINFQVFGDYKFQLDTLEFLNSSPQWRPTYSNDRFLIGINIGFEWTYKKTK